MSISVKDELYGGPFSREAQIAHGELYEGSNSREDCYRRPKMKRPELSIMESLRVRDSNSDR